ncbi:hypothetical protein OXPF_00150 [Oxobacter pfennigii]|uniref:DUF4367 domain-containing protein n=1 Tax=Oxobacter pfennigii TaxID=36849 RepID=A0A0P8Z2I2_9CLOT|nr:DUF4367 domain-containing protein [Oxobacter pfennigii]KPU46373.1 hypothetical protein OXPF_00150 [Oxobacter pfennigii]
MIRDIDNNIDKLIEEALQEEYDSIVCPSKEEAWEQFLINLRKERRKEKLKRLKPLIAAGIIMSVMTGLFISFQEPVLAFADRIIKNIEIFTGNTFTIDKSIGNNEDTGPGLENVTDNNSMVIDAQNKVNFKLLVPGYIPEGYKLSVVDVTEPEIVPETVIFVYYNLNGQDKDNFIQIVQKSLANNTKMSMNININENTEIKRLEINGVEYTIVNYDNEFTKILWDIGNISYKLDVTMDVETALKILKSMK